jgi:hypothetical protein
VKTTAVLGNSDWELHRGGLILEGTNAMEKRKYMRQKSDDENAARLSSDPLNIISMHITQRTRVCI